jgi:hypothetical protein
MTKRVPPPATTDLPPLDPAVIRLVDVLARQLAKEDHEREKQQDGELEPLQ